jgi:S-adenosylhomocysteine hydrolase
MDMSFANQALSAEYMVKNHSTLAEDGATRSRGARQTGRQAEAGSDEGCRLTGLTMEQEKHLLGEIVGKGIGSAPIALKQCGLSVRSG